MPETLVLDPTSEDATNVPLTLTTGSYGLLEHHYPQPAIDPQWASSVSTEGAALASNRHQNREISITVDVDCTANLTPLRTLQAKLTKLFREGGTLQRTMSDATVIVFDILTTDGYDPSFDQTWHLGSITTVSFTLTCKPLGRGTEQTLTSHSETTLPALVFTETGIKGDVPALGRLVVSEGQSQDQNWVVWGVQSRYYSSAASAALFWQAEALTLQGGSTTTVGTGASGGNIVRNTTLATSYQSVLSTGSMTHVGSFRVFARMMIPTTNVGAVSVALEWSRYEFAQAARNTPVTLNSIRTAAWQMVDLGVITIPSDSPSWEGHIVAASGTFGDDLDIDTLMFVPVDEGHGDARGLLAKTAPAAIAAQDNFATGTGALNTNALQIGGTWATSGATTDYAYSSATVARSTNVVETTPRFALAGSSTFATIDASVDMTTSVATTLQMGLVLRYVDASNYLVVVWDGDLTHTVSVIKNIAGTKTTIGTFQYLFTSATPIYHTLRARVDPAGRVYVWINPASSTQSINPATVMFDTNLAVGGALATGKVGISDQTLTTTASTRNYDNFYAYVPTLDAAMFAGQSIEVRHDRVRRQNFFGTALRPVSYYAGDYLKIPVAGAEGRTTRIIVKAARNNPDYGPDSAIDDITAQLFYTPRWLNVPSA